VRLRSKRGVHRRRWLRGVEVIAATGAIVFAGVPRAFAQDINADIGIVSVTASAKHAHVGDLVVFTAVAEDFGPDPIVDDSLDVTYYNPTAFHVLRERCSGGISPDTPSCEFGAVAAGEKVAVQIVGRVLADRGDYAVLSFCVSDESGGRLQDPNPVNDCGTAQVRIVGPH